MVLYGAELKEPHTELLLSSPFCPSLALCSVSQTLILGTQGSHMSATRRCGFRYQGSQWDPDSGVWSWSWQPASDRLQNRLKGTVTKPSRDVPRQLTCPLGLLPPSAQPKFHPWGLPSLDEKQ